MKILVMGTGGVGGYFGARLASAGHEVAFVARGRHLQALRETGLRIESPHGNLHLRDIQVGEDPAALGPADLVLLGVKLWDTEAAAAALLPLARAGSLVISFQNGVVKDDILRAALGTSAVASGVCYIGASIAEPGLVRQTGAMHKLVFGANEGHHAAVLQRFAHACTGAGFDHELSADIRRAIWEKFVFLVGLSGSTACTRTPIGVVRSHERSRAFLHDLMAEVVRVALAEGVALPTDYAAQRLAFCDTLAPAMTSSLHHDLERGNRLEVPWLAGDVVARGQRLGVATPCNRAVMDILSVHAAGRA